MSNTNNNLQTQTSNALHNAIMEAGGKDRPPMLAPESRAEDCLLSQTLRHPKEHQNEVNEIRAERLARTANPLALVLLKQTTSKAIVNSSTPTYDQEPTTVTKDNEMSKEKEIDKLMALISLSFKKIYKPTNINLQTSSNTHRANQDNSPRNNRGTVYENQRVVTVAGARENVGTMVVPKSGIQCYNCKEYGHVSRECQKPKRAKDATYHKEKMLLCKQEEAGVQLNAEQADWKDDTDDEYDDQELEARYMYMTQIQEVTPDIADISGPIFDTEPLQKKFQAELDRTRQPIVVPISTREPKQTVNQSVATSHKKTVTTDSTVKKPRNIIWKIYEQYDTVTGLPKLKFIKDHLCSSCELGKAKRKSFHPKATSSSKRRLQILHMDLCGPMRVESFNGKKYMLVIVDDYSRYTWTHFLRSKDKTPKFLIDFLKLVQRGLHAQVRTFRTDKGIEFLDKTLHAYFAQEGIEHQTSTARTPEQNGIVKRRNRAFVEAARTMLSTAKVLLFFWAEAIATSCFTQNRSLVIP
ncbi:retrovirus-related pol polyprotein from transposon TNT 1-94 [Tanacetum coccineum]